MSSRCLELLLCIGLVALGGCQREERRLSEPPPGSVAIRSVQQSDIRPGGTPAPQSPQFAYDSNAHAISQGKQLYEWFNCSGCHAFGGGAIGPPLMDDQWIYGEAPENIFATIVEGRPNGMPSFGGKIPDTQIWMIVAYVESMSGQAPIDVMPGRSDHMRYSTPENVRRAQTPKQTGAQ